MTPFRGCALTSLALSVCFIAPNALHGATAHLLVDANPAPPAANATAFYKPPSQLAALDGRVLFFVEESSAGINPPKPGPGLQLWVTDGTVEGTELLAGFCTDETVICEIPFRSSFLGRIGSSWLFAVPRAQGDEHLDLWRTDGTPEGTSLLKPDICPDPDDLGSIAVVAGGSLFFAGFDAEAGCELWHSDGTAAGSGRVADLTAGTDDSSPRGFATLGGRAFFTLDSPSEQGGLWVTDGTSGGTSLVATFSRIELLTTVGSRMFFVAADDLDRSGTLWTSDGTTAGTRPLRHFALYEICAESECFPQTVFLQPDGDGVVFLANDGDGLSYWRSDSAPGSTRRLTRLFGAAGPGLLDQPRDHGIAARLPGSLLLLITQRMSTRLWASQGGLAAPLGGCPGGCPAVHSLLQPVPGGQRVVFSGWNGRSKGTELWTSDGTAAGTHLVRDLCTRHCSSDPYNFLALGDAVYFTAVDEEGPGLWRTDGTTAGTVFLGRAFAPQISPPALPPGGAVLGDQVVLGLQSASGLSQLWITAGSAASTRPLATFDRAVSSSNPQFAGLGDRVVFAAQGNQDQDSSLWSSDGVTSQLLISTSQAAGERVDGFSAPIVAGGKAFAFAGDFTVGAVNQGHLVVTDGTPAGTRTIADLGDTFVRLPTEFKGRLVFVLESAGQQTVSLWSSDGTAEGTKALLSLPPAVTQQLVSVGGFLYFFSVVNDDYSLFRSDGTADGTASFGSFRDVGDDPEVFATGGQLYFTADGALYKLNGTAVDGDTFAGFSEVMGLTDLGGRLLFFGIGPGDSPQRGLWSSDGTAEGTIFLAEVSGQPPGLELGTFGPPVWMSAGGNLLVQGWDAGHGFELWFTNGTAAGTTRLDLAPGLASSFPELFAVAAGRLWFTANDQAHGREIWVSDGTPAGTHQTMDLAPGIFSAIPNQLTVAGGNLFFSAYTPLNGQEPWVLPLAGVP